MKEKIISCIKGFLTAYALVTVFHTPLSMEAYETGLDFYIDSIYELLGAYDFKFLLIGIACSFFYLYTRQSSRKQESGHPILACFFASCVLLGNSYHEAGCWEYCFGSVVNFLKTGLAFAGYSFLFHEMLRGIDCFLQKGRFVDEKQHFFSEHAFGKTALILFAVYLPFLILSYPGNLCWDVIGQIEQVIFNTGYSAHHPIVHTLVVGGFVQLGDKLFQSYEIGLFMYMLFQLVLFVSALAWSVAVLAKRKVKFGVLTVLIALYAIAPVYSNVASTAVKDVPFVSFVIGYIICFCMLIENPQKIKCPRFTGCFILLQLGMILFRNNGIYVACIAGVVAVGYLWKKYNAKERFKSILVFFAASVVVSKVILVIIGQILNVTPGSSGEMLSIPFQQTARYLQFYQKELTEDEKASIEAVLGDVSEVAAKYDPDISDPVKALFKKDASGSELIGYFKTWLICFFKHPAVYFEAFFHHVYGWLSPFVANSVRYEVEYDTISQQGLFPQASKLVLFYYRFASRFSLLSVLENVGVYVWSLLFMSAFYWKRRNVRNMVILSPLWVSLFICIASPCFFLHPRYAFPIMFTIPFLICFMISFGQKERN